MSQPTYKKIGEYRFYSGDEYKEGLNDLKKIKTLMGKGDLTDQKIASKLYQQLLAYPYMFESLIGEEFIGKLLLCSNGYPERIDKFFASLFLGYKSKISTSRSTYAGERVYKEQSYKGEVVKRREALTKERELDLRRQGTRSKVENPSFERHEKIHKRHESDLAFTPESKISDGSEETKTVKNKKSYKKDVAFFLAGMLTCFIILTARDALSNKASIDNSMNKLKVLAASILEPVDSLVSDEIENMDVKPSISNESELQVDMLENIEATIKDDQKELEGDILPKILYQYSALYDMNQDIAGWIKIDDTIIDYPVMQTKEDEEYYLYRDFDREDSKTGLPFFDAECDILKPTSNYLIHAHNMKNGTMFAALHNYKQEEFYKEHKIIHLDTIYEAADYEIVSVFQSRVAYQHEEVFKYYNFINAKTKEEYDTFIKEIKILSYYDTGITPEYGEQLITLSTCDRSIDDGRLVVVARKIIKNN